MAQQKLIITKFLVITILLTGIWLLFLETNHPLFFTNYDGITYNLSYYTHNWRSIIDYQTIPLINFHQSLGQTHLPSTHSNVLSPLPYIAFGLSKLFFSDTFHVIEIMAIFYRLAGAVVMFLFLKQLKTPPALCLLGSLVWSTYPYLVTLGAVWPPDNNLILYLPLNFLLLNIFTTKPQIKSAVLLTLPKLWFFFGSYVEHTFWVLFFELLIVITIMLKKIDRGGIKPAVSLLTLYLLSIMIFLLASTPLLLPMYEAQINSYFRSTPLSKTDFSSFPTRLKTFTDAQLFKYHPQTLWKANSSIYYVGIFNLALLLLLFVRKIRHRTKAHRTPLYGTIALIAYLLSTSLYGYLYELPIISHFARAHKTVPFFIFFLTLAIIGIASAVAETSKALGKKAIYSIVFLSLAINILVVWNNKDTAWSIKELSSPLTIVQKDIRPERGRTFSFVDKLDYEDYSFTTYNFASLYGLNDFAGYDTLIAKINYELTLYLDAKAVFLGFPDKDLLDYLSSWSVRYLITRNNINAQNYFNQHAQLKPLYQDEAILLYENTNALPYVYSPTEPKKTVPHEFRVNEVNIYPTDHTPHQLIVNIAPLPRYVVYFDDRKIGRVVPAYGPIMINVPADTTHILVRYEDPLFQLGVTLFLATWLSLLLIYLIHQATLNKRLRHRPAGTKGHQSVHLTAHRLNINCFSSITSFIKKSFNTTTTKKPTTNDK